MPVSIEIASSVQAYFTSQCPFVCVTILSAIHAIQKNAMHVLTHQSFHAYMPVMHVLHA